MKKIILGVVLVIVILFVVMVSKDLKNNPIEKADSSSTEETVDVIFDAPAYTRITYDELVNILGEPKSTEEWNNETSKGTFLMNIYTYDLEDAYVEFIVYEDAVVKVRWFSNDSVEILDDFDNVFSMFNITLKDSAKKIADTGTTYKFSPVSDNVAEFDVYNYDSENHTFDTVYITYNLNYFD